MAIQCIRNRMPLREAELAFNIPKSTLANKVKNKHSEPIGKPTILLKEKVNAIVDALIVALE
uniref:HTH psq-type domain-containing protein n=1 Tax=Romanomermis culicivorax TaxID=13658 RepID=A0A915KYX3_ROMCU